MPSCSVAGLILCRLDHNIRDLGTSHSSEPKTQKPNPSHPLKIQEAYLVSVSRGHQGSWRSTYVMSLFLQVCNSVTI